VAQDYACLQGEHVALTGARGPFRICPDCGNDEGKIAPGKGPHLACVQCINCGGFVAWLGRDHLSAMMARGHVDG
jgi:hypothetical protein